MDSEHAHKILDEWISSHYQTDKIDVRQTVDEMGLLFKKRRSNEE